MDKIAVIDLAMASKLEVPQFMQLIDKLGQAAGGAAVPGPRTGLVWPWLVAPVDDVAAFAGRLNLGAVTDVDISRKTFRLDPDPTKL